MDHVLLGTWRTYVVAEEKKLIRLDKDRLTLVQAATLLVNPTTAYRMLNDFVKLKPGDWVIQNGANSMVGRAVIEIAKRMGVRTANIVRDRPNFQELADELTKLGADVVIKQEELRNPAQRELFAEAKPLLGLNCVGGPATTDMARLLGHGATLVTYGGMSKQPVTLPTTSFIFNDLRAVGYWMTNWSKQATREQRQDMFSELAKMYHEGSLTAPPVSMVDWTQDSSDDMATTTVREALEKAMSGYKDTKVVLSMSYDEQV